MYISPLAMAYSLLVSGLLSQIINSWPNKKLLNYSYIGQMKDIMPSIALAIFMGIIVYLIGLIKLPIIISLIIQIIVGGVIYIAGAKILKIDSLYYLLELLKSILKKNQKIIKRDNYENLDYGCQWHACKSSKRRIERK